MEKFELLRAKNILAILDGDTDFGEIEVSGAKGNIKNSMPYLSGPMICDISNTFGLPVSYSWSGGAQSRWAYMDDLLAHCVQQKRMPDLLSFLFSKSQFIEKLNGYTPDVIDSAYETIVATAIAQINGALYFGGNELVIINGKYCIREIGKVIPISAPAIKVVDRSYITDLSSRALKDVEEGNFDSSITKARTLLEEVFCYVIEQKGESPSDSGDIGKLYKQVKNLYNMHADKDVDRRINMLLSGLEKILSSIAEMRNEASDAHGVGERRISIKSHHARLFVNSAQVMADFILSVAENAK